MTCQITSVGFWDSTPIGRSIELCLCQYEQLSPQLILEDKVFRSGIHSQTHFIGTLISDDESQRLTYVIDRLLAADAITNGMNNHRSLNGEFLIPIHYDNQNLFIRNSLMQDGIKEIDAYCHSALPIELHRFSYLCAQISSHHSSSIHLSFHLLTIKNTFTLTPINPGYVQIVPTALLKNLSSSSRNNLYMKQPHFGYCSLDQMSRKNILLLLENDPQACTLPLVGIWISGIIDIQCAFVWEGCLRYCLNSSFKQRLCSGITPQQAFLLACYSPTSYGQCIFYEVHLPSSLTIDYDLWTSSKRIMIPNLSYDNNSTTQFPYDFQFKRVYNEPQNFPSLLPNRPSDNHHQVTLSSPNTNGSLFGIPRLPPKQTSHQSPSWDTIITTPITPSKRRSQSSAASPAALTVGITSDTGWKEEFLERMQSYETHIQSLTALVTQLLTTPQNSLPTSIKECTKRDVAVQSEPSSPCINDEILSTIKNNRDNSRSPKTEHYQQQISPISADDQLITPPVDHHQEPMSDYSSLCRSTTPSSVPTDLDPVDILKPIFQFIDNQQHKQQQASTRTADNSNDTALVKTNDEDTDRSTGNMCYSTNITQQQQQQQQHVTSTRTTGITFISNGVQMQFINQQSSTTTVHPQPQLTAPPPPVPPLPAELLPTSPQKSENNLSIEVHGLEMKYLEDEQLAVAIECNRQAQTPQTVDKSLSFGTQEYLQRYGLFTDTNSS